MPANTSPIFTLGAELSFTSAITNYVQGTGVQAYNGTSAVTYLASGASNGTFIQKLVCEANGGTAGSIPACVLRIYVNNGGDNTVSANNVLYYQYSLPLVARSDTIATTHIEIPLNLHLPPNYRLFVGIGSTTSLLSGWYVVAVGGDY